MDYTATYCPTRRDLEEQGWWLTSRLALLTDRLMRQIGQDHRVFVETRRECRETRVAITDSHLRLREHRGEHGC